MGKLSEPLSAASLDLVLHAFENHKEHARFQETQRSWFMIAYLGISGVVWAAVLDRLFQASFPEPARLGATIALSFLALLGLMTGLAITKTGVEFRRHFHCAEAIIAKMKEAAAADPTIVGLLDAAMLGTAGDQNEGWKRAVSKHLGVAALHNYLIAAMIGSEAAAIGLLWGFALPLVVALFVVGFIVASNLFYAYRGIVFSRQG